MNLRWLPGVLAGTCQCCYTAFTINVNVECGPILVAVSSKLPSVAQEYCQTLAFGASVAIVAQCHMLLDTSFFF